MKPLKTLMNNLQNQVVRWTAAEVEAKRTGATLAEGEARARRESFEESFELLANLFTDYQIVKRPSRKSPRRRSFKLEVSKTELNSTTTSTVSNRVNSVRA